MTGNESVVRRLVNRETSTRARSREKSAVCFEYTDGEGERQRVRLAHTDDPDRALTVKVPDARSYDDRLPEHPLPASGETLDDCGEQIPGLVCEDCGDTKDIGRTCRRSRCPRCWQSWAFQRAKTHTSKIESLGRYEYAREKKKVKQHHVTLSFRASTRFNSTYPLDRAIEAVKLLMDQISTFSGGGYIVYHPYRIAPKHRGKVPGHNSGQGDMTWKDVLAIIESDGWDAARKYLVYAPHFHVITLAAHVMGGAVTHEIKAKTGVVIERIATERDDGIKRSIVDLTELCKVITYALSHAALIPSEDEYRVVARPFGRVANFEAFYNVEQETDRALRRVAPTVLGIEFPDTRCSDRHPGHPRDNQETTSNPRHEPETPTPPFTAATTGTSLSGNAVDLPVAALSGDADPCGGQLRPIWIAPTLLGDLEWINRIEAQYGENRLHDLRRKYEEWGELGEPRPAVPPPPTDATRTGPASR